MIIHEEFSPGSAEWPSGYSAAVAPADFADAIREAFNAFLKEVGRQ